MLTIDIARTDELPTTIAPNVQLPEHLVDHFPMVIGAGGKVTTAQRAILGEMIAWNAKLGENGTPWSEVLDTIVAIGKRSEVAKVAPIETFEADETGRVLILDRVAAVAVAMGHTVRLSAVPGRPRREGTKARNERKDVRFKVQSWLEQRLGVEWYAVVFPIVSES